jgi:hypothetical protein
MSFSAGDLRYADSQVLTAERALDAEMLLRREELRAMTPIVFETELLLPASMLTALSLRFEARGWRVEARDEGGQSRDGDRLIRVRLTEEQHQRTGDETV